MRLSVTQLDVRGKRVLLPAEYAEFSVSGVGDTVAATRRAGVADKLGCLPPSGAAFLEALEGRGVPGAAAL